MLIHSKPRWSCEEVRPTHSACYPFWRIKAHVITFRYDEDSASLKEVRRRHLEYVIDGLAIHNIFNLLGVTIVKTHEVNDLLLEGIYNITQEFEQWASVKMR